MSEFDQLDRWLTTDPDGESRFNRQDECNRIIERVMNEPDELMEIIGSDAYDILREIIGALTQPSEAGEQADHWLLRCYHDANGVLLRRARMYAEGVCG